MAANKFASMIHRNTNNIVLILVYAVLEWTLIVLLLLNSLFNYLIQKFADYFGLKPPCPLCSRIDSLFEPSPNKTYSSYQTLLCESHAAEISSLWYCKNHRKLADVSSMCVDCSSDQNDDDSLCALRRRIEFVRWIGSTNKQFEYGPDHGSVSCSCCKEKVMPDYLLFKSSWRVLNDEKNKDLIVEEISDENTGDGNDNERGLEQRNDVEMAVDETKMLYGLSLREPSEEDSLKSTVANSLCKEEEIAMEFHCRFASDIKDDSLSAVDLRFAEHKAYDPDPLMPIELIDSLTNANKRQKNFQSRDLSPCCSGNDIKFNPLEESESSAIDFVQESGNCQVAVTLVQNTEESYQDKVRESSEQNYTVQQAKTLLKDRKSTQKPEDHLAEEQETDKLSLLNDPSETEMLIRAECSDDQTRDFQPEALVVGSAAEATSPSSRGMGWSKKEPHERSKDIASEETTREVIKTHEAEEEPLPRTPTPLETLNYLHRKLLLFEKREFGAEESIDVSEMEGADPVHTIDQLKAALESERRALRTLYTELEEERSASAVAANQTMAMITRLQEEKAAMQMESLQYQRMMEEQSEYDQEALQLLNELMLKREKEKQELERELEICRKKVLDYKAMENMRETRNLNSCDSCTDPEDSDGLSIDLNREFPENNADVGVDTSTNEVINLEEITLECVKHMSALDESLIEFEEERLSILDQLKALQEKLVNVEDDGFQENTDRASVQQGDEDYGDRLTFNVDFSERLSMTSMAKSLLPFLDAAENKTDNEKLEPGSIEMQQSLVSNAELDDPKQAIIEQVDNVYERLQALETDGEFLKHCMSSIKKGDKGMNLLQEILHHLRDLRTIELTKSNMITET